MALAKPWKQYQEDAASYFRSVGLDAKTDETLTGVRSRHDIDVVVRFRSAGMDHLWIVECKLHARPIAKDRALLLRTIVDDVGADRGILLAERGFQSGAREVVTGTNVVVTSLAELRTESMDEIFGMELSQLAQRISAARDRIDALSKHQRHDHVGGGSLRIPALAEGVWPSGTIGLIGSSVVLEKAIEKARRGDFPVCYGHSADGRSRLIASRDNFLDLAGELVEQIEELVGTLKDVRCR